VKNKNLKQLYAVFKDTIRNKTTNKVSITCGEIYDANIKSRRAGIALLTKPLNIRKVTGDIEDIP
jgi:hypothetical protein